jgi:hypothetical protein
MQVRTLTSNEANTVLGQIEILTEKELIVAYYDRVSEDGIQYKDSVTKKVRVISAIVPLLAIHVALSENKDEKLRKRGKEFRSGNAVNRLITETEYRQWVINLAIDYYNRNGKPINEIDMSLVVYPPYYDVTDAEGNVLQEGLVTKFSTLK